MDTANRNTLGYVGSKPGAKDATRDSDSWFTPPQYVAAAREILQRKDGRIAFDPFSSDDANNHPEHGVNAARYFTISDDALTSDWPRLRAGGVWVNPPYGQGICTRAIERVIEQYQAGRFSLAIVLVNNATDTRWFQAMARIAAARCDTHHRIAFWNTDGKRMSGNTRGQTFFLFDRTGRKVAQFAELFSQFGCVYGAPIAAQERE